MKRDIKGPLSVWGRLGLGYGLGYQTFSPVFHFLTFCSLAFCPLAFCSRFDLVYTAEIRGQPLVLLYKMIVSVCVQAGQRKLPDRIVKFFLGVIDSSMEIEILKFYISYSISSNCIISKLTTLVLIIMYIIRKILRIQV